MKLFRHGHDTLQDSLQEALWGCVGGGGGGGKLEGLKNVQELEGSEAQELTCIHAESWEGGDSARLQGHLALAVLIQDQAFLLC